MKIKTLTVALVCLIGLNCFLVEAAVSAPISEGAKCLKLNSTVKAGDLSFKCLKSGKKLILVAKYKKCADVVIANRAPIVKETNPLLYLANSGLDRDKDGIACDK